MENLKNIEKLSSWEFNRRMENDEEFRKEMIRRQTEAVSRLSMHPVCPPPPKKNNGSPSDEDITQVTGCSLHFIQKAPLKSLRKAVKDHRLSAARYRIEVKRRKQRVYYDCLPDSVYEAPDGL